MCQEKKEMKKQLSEKELLISGFEKRIKFKKQQLFKTKKFNREVEANLARKIKLDQMQLNALKK